MRERLLGVRQRPLAHGRQEMVGGFREEPQDLLDGEALARAGRPLYHDVDELLRVEVSAVEGQVDELRGPRLPGEAAPLYVLGEAVEDALLVRQLLADLPRPSGSLQGLGLGDVQEADGPAERLRDAL